MVADDLIGEIVGGRYVVERILGQGGMGTIYEVSHQILGRKFAMKTLSAHLMDDPRAAARLFREADSVAKLRHPNVVDIFGWESLADGSPCIVMEFLRGEDLGRRIRRVGALDWGTLARLADEVLAAITVAHAAGIVHRDLKPPNIFLAIDDEGGERAKLLDFGLSKLREAQGQHASNTGGVIGTPSYMSPEQADPGRGEIGPHTDVWAMGAVLYEMATGHVAFPGIGPVQVLYRICYGEPESLRELRPDAPDAFVEVVAGALSRDPDRRLTSAAELRRQLRLALAGVTLDEAETPTPIEPFDLGTGTGTHAAGMMVTPTRWSPPTGIVTFLFTEIVDSVRLWEEYPEEMKDAISRHDSILHEAMSFHGGYVFRTGADSFGVAFSHAGDAAKAAVAAQKMIDRAPWRDVGPLQVRMAIHTGPAYERDGEYFGPTLNRAARILALVEGAHVILSGATVELIRDDLPEGGELTDLGVHPLRDLTRPEHVYQLNHPELAHEEPSLLIPAKVRNNLPHALSSFVGRKKELASVRDALRKNRLVTVTGLGGSGKTRLVLQAAADELAVFSGGVWLVELASLTDGELVPQTVAQTLDLLREGMFAPAMPWIERLAQHLASRSLLLVLDNCEHLIESCAGMVGALLRRCPELKVLATSREPLGVEGEVAYSLAPLAVPQARTDNADAMEMDAVRLFVERARVAKPDFALTAATIGPVAQICRALDGIPLAIELAAARTSILSIDGLAKRLEDRLQVLSASSRSLPARQKSLRATLDWSYELLSPEEQTLLARLSVFRGSFPLAAVEAICDGDGVDQELILDLMSTLSQKSLVRLAMGDGEPRYQLLDIVRQYAEEKLASDGNVHAFHARHRDWYVELAERAEPELRGASQTMYLDELEAEFDNIRAALRWALDEDNGTGAIRLSSALWAFWRSRGPASEGLRYLELSLATDKAARPNLRAKALAACGMLTANSNPPRAHQLLRESLEVARASNDPAVEAFACCGLGTLAHHFGRDLAGAQSWLTESLRICMQSKDNWGVGNASAFLAIVTDDLGDRTLAEQLCHQAVTAFEHCGDRVGLAMALNSAGELARAHGDAATSAAFYQRGLALCRDLGDTTSIIVVLTNLGMAQSTLGDYLSAESCLREGLALTAEVGFFFPVPVCLIGLARAAVSRGNLRRAARLLGCSRGVLPAIGHSQLLPHDQSDFDSIFGQLSGLLEATEMTDGIKRGESMSLPEAIAFGHDPSVH